MGFFSGLFGGASKADTNLQNQSAAAFSNLQNEQQIMFGTDQDALNTVNNAMTPIVNGGAYQYGFSTAEDQNLQNEITNAGAMATANSVAAQQLRNQQMSGGASVMPTGAQEALEGAQRELGAQQTATNLAQEKEAGYQTGRQNFFNAAQNEEQVASLSNPTGFANAATGAGNLELGANKQVDTANANSLTSKLLGGAIGGVVGGALGGPAGAAKGFSSGFSAPAPNYNAGGNNG